MRQNPNSHSLEKVRLVDGRPTPERFFVPAAARHMLWFQSIISTPVNGQLSAHLPAGTAPSCIVPGFDARLVHYPCIDGFFFFLTHTHPYNRYLPYHHPNSAT